MSNSEDHIVYAETKCAELVDEATKLREEVWLSQRDVSEAMGLSSHGNLALIERHKSIPRLNGFLRILSVLGYTLKIVPKK